MSNEFNFQWVPYISGINIGYISKLNQREYPYVVKQFANYSQKPMAIG